MSPEMIRTIAGNAISLMSSIFLCLSGLARSKKNIYLLQFLECIFIITSQIVFGQFAGAISMLFSAARNILASNDKYTFPAMVIIFAGAGSLGVALSIANGAAGFDFIIGLIPVISSLFLSVAAYYFKRVMTVRISVIISLILWILYSFLILDIVSGITNTVALILNFYIVIKDIKAKA